MPKAVNDSGFYDKDNCPQRYSIPGPRALIIIIIIIISNLYSAYYRKKNIGATDKIKNKKLL